MDVTIKWLVRKFGEFNTFQWFSQLFVQISKFYSSAQIFNKLLLVKSENYEILNTTVTTEEIKQLEH